MHCLLGSARRGMVWLSAHFTDEKVVMCGSNFLTLVIQVTSGGERIQSQEGRDESICSAR